MYRCNIRVARQFLGCLLGNGVVDGRAKVIPELCIAVRHRPLEERKLHVALLDDNVLRLVAVGKALHYRVENPRVFARERVAVERGSGVGAARRRGRRRGAAGGRVVRRIGGSRSLQRGAGRRSLHCRGRLIPLIEGIGGAFFQAGEGCAVLPGGAVAGVFAAAYGFEHDLCCRAAVARRRGRRFAKVVCFGDRPEGARNRSAEHGARNLQRKLVSNIDGADNVARAGSNLHIAALPDIHELAGGIVVVGEVGKNRNAVPCFAGGHNHPREHRLRGERSRRAHRRSKLGCGLLDALVEIIARSGRKVMERCRALPVDLIARVFVSVGSGERDARGRGGSARRRGGSRRGADRAENRAGRARERSGLDAAGYLHRQRLVDVLRRRRKLSPAAAVGCAAVPGVSQRAGVVGTCQRRGKLHAGLHRACELHRPRQRGNGGNARCRAGSGGGNIVRGLDAQVERIA